MEKEEGWVLNLYGRARIMNINLFFLFITFKGAALVVAFSPPLFLCFNG